MKLSKLRNECYDLINKIVKNGDINKEGVIIVLAMRLNIPIENCRISKFDEETCNKCLKMLKKML